jgi:hypothetical protein
MRVAATGTDRVGHSTIFEAEIPVGSTNPFGVGFGRTPHPEAMRRAAEIEAPWFRNGAFLKRPGSFQHDPAEVRGGGFRQMLSLYNVDWTVNPLDPRPPTQSSVPVDFGVYSLSAAQAIEVVAPELLVVENEASVPAHFAGGPDDMARMLAAILPLGEQYGIPVATDGPTSQSTVSWLYGRLAFELGRAAEAEWFWALAVAPGQTKPSPAHFAQMNAWWVVYRDSGTIPNFHSYTGEPESTAFTLDEIESFTGRRPLCNEWGIKSDPLNAARMTAMMQAWSDGGVLVAQYWSSGVNSLYDSNGVLHPIGRAFKDFVGAL